MIAIPEVGTVLGRFESTLERARVWRVDWSVGLDVLEYQDPEVAWRAGHSDIPIPPGALVFFSFLPDDSWTERAGIRFDRSLAVRRRIRIHHQLHVGDTVRGRPTIAAVDVRHAKQAVIVTTAIATCYELDGEPAVEETVTYATRHPEGGA